jgi:predicted DNA-binding transcriptional regulator AlpA
MELLNLDEVCEALRIAPSTGRNRLSSGGPMPPSFKMGGRRFFVKDQVNAWLEKQAEAASAAEVPLKKTRVNTRGYFLRRSKGLL